MIIPDVMHNASSAAQICELNMVNMLNSLQKFPSRIFYMILLSMLGLLIYIYVTPWLKGELRAIVQHSAVLFAAGLLIFSIISQAAMTFTISEATWKGLETATYAFTGLWLLIYGFTNRKKIEAFLKGLEVKE